MLTEEPVLAHYANDKITSDQPMQAKRSRNNIMAKTS